MGRTKPATLRGSTQQEVTVADLDELAIVLSLLEVMIGFCAGAVATMLYDDCCVCTHKLKAAPKAKPSVSVTRPTINAMSSTSLAVVFLAIAQQVDLFDSSLCTAMFVLAQCGLVAIVAANFFASKPAAKKTTAVDDRSA